MLTQMQSLRDEAQDYVIHGLERHNAAVPCQTLARSVIGSADVLQNQHDLMRDVLLDSALIHVDETVVQVLKKKDKAPTLNSYMWCKPVARQTKPVVMYAYDAHSNANGEMFGGWAWPRSTW